MMNRQHRSPIQYRPRRIGLRLLLAVILIHAASVQAVSGASPVHPARPGAEASVARFWPGSDLHPDPSVILGRLPNGFRFVLYPNQKPAGRVSMHLYVGAGSLNETAEQRGLAHFLEHMMFNGTTHFPPGELVKYFQRIGMQFGPDANAYTSFSETVYDVLLPDNSAEAITEGLVVLKDYAQGALLLPSEVDRERPVVLAEKRSRDSASYRTFVRTLAFELPDAVVSKRLPIGTASVLQSAGSELLRAFYDAWYRPDNMVLVMVGDIQPPAVTKLIDRMFSSITARGPRAEPPAFGTVHHQGVKAFYHGEKEIGHTTVTLETLAMIPPEPDTAERRHRRLAAHVADRIVHHRLEAMIGTSGTPFTSAQSSSGVFLGRIAYAEMSADCSADQWQETLTALEHTLRQAMRYGFTDDALARVKAEIRADLRQAVETQPTRESPTIARHLIRSLRDARVPLSPEQERTLLMPELDRLTLDDVHRAFRRTWSADHRLVLVTGDAVFRPELGTPPSQILTAYMQSHAVTVGAPESDARVRFPYLPVPEGGSVAARRDIDDLGAVQVDFSNGLRLNLKKTDFSAGSVMARLVFGNGRRDEPPELAGIGHFAEDLVNESGLGALKKDALARALAGKQSRVRFSVAPDRFVFQAHSVPDELPLLFQLLHAHLRDSAFRESVRPLLIERYRQQFRKLAATIGGAPRGEGWQWLAGGDHRFGMPSPETYAGFTASQVKQWLGDAISRAPAELTLVGDFDTAEAIRLAGRYLGAIPGLGNGASSGSHPGDGPRFPAGREVRLRVDTRIQNALLVLAFPTTDMWDIRTTRRLAVLSDIITDRMRLRIREALGATYTAYATNRPSRTYDGYGMLLCFVQVDPRQADVILAELRRVVANVRANGITEDELRRALDPTLTNLKDLRRENDYWLETVLSDSVRHPQQLDWSRHIVSDYAGIGVGDVMGVAQRYLRISNAAVIKIEPVRTDGP